jgi:hypothetical protein
MSPASGGGRNGLLAVQSGRMDRCSVNNKFLYSYFVSIPGMNERGIFTDLHPAARIELDDRRGSCLNRRGILYGKAFMNPAK